MRVGDVVEVAVGAEVVVDVHQVVAPATEELVLTGAADDPVVAEVTEDRVVAVTAPWCRSATPSLLRKLRKNSLPAGPEHDLRHRRRTRRRARTRWPTCRIEVDAVRDVVAEHVTRVERPVEVAAHGEREVESVVGDVRLTERLGARHRVVAGTAVQGVVAQAAEDDVVGEPRPEDRLIDVAGRVEVERRQVRPCS